MSDPLILQMVYLDTLAEIFLLFFNVSLLIVIGVLMYHIYKEPIEQSDENDSSVDA